MYTFYFEKLEVWKQSQDFTCQVYSATNNFPPKELFGLTSQIRRASVSISANIAEGFSRKTNKEKARFINMAYSSGWEVLNHLILAKKLIFLTNEKYLELRSELESITAQLNSLHHRLEQNDS